MIFLYFNPRLFCDFHYKVSIIQELFFFFFDVTQNLLCHVWLQFWNLVIKDCQNVDFPLGKQ